MISGEVLNVSISALQVTKSKSEAHMTPNPCDQYWSTDRESVMSPAMKTATGTPTA